MTADVWEPIDGWSTYQINRRTGAVRSLDHVDQRGRRWSGRLLRVSTPKPTVPASRSGGKSPRCTLSDGPRRSTFYPLRYLDNTQQKRNTAP